ncbi:hypothetical protein EVAR_100414_1, partial [Eumeta japonica]
MVSCLYDLKEYEVEIRMDELFVKCLPCRRLNNPALSTCGLQETVNKIKDSVKKGVKINVDKIEVIAFERGESMIECDILIE